MVVLLGSKGGWSCIGRGVLERQDGVRKYCLSVDQDNVRNIQFLDIPDIILIRSRKTMVTQQVLVKLHLIIFLHQYFEAMNQNTTNMERNI